MSLRYHCCRILCTIHPKRNHTGAFVGDGCLCVLISKYKNRKGLFVVRVRPWHFNDNYRDPKWSVDVKRPRNEGHLEPLFILFDFFTGISMWYSDGIYPNLLPAVGKYHWHKQTNRIQDWDLNTLLKNEYSYIWSINCITAPRTAPMRIYTNSKFSMCILSEHHSFKPWPDLNLMRIFSYLTRTKVSTKCLFFAYLKSAIPFFNNTFISS